MKITNHKIDFIDEKEIFLFPELELLGLRLILTSSKFNKYGISLQDKADELNNIYKYLGIAKENVYSGYQTHSDNIAVIENNNPQNDEMYGYEYPNTDALISDNDEVVTVTKFADCTPIVIFDKNKKVISNIHSGWKGTQKKIYLKVINIFLKDFNSNPKDLIIFIGPAIHSSEFEVGEDLILEFNKSYGNIDKYLKAQKNNKYLFDMSRLIIDNFTDIGISSDNIYMTNLSTLSDPLLHSYRRDKDKSGRMWLFAKMR